MSRPFTRRPHKQPAIDSRVFADDSGRLWSAVRTASAVVFTCISDTQREDETGDETLRAWLGAAPKIGSLS